MLDLLVVFNVACFSHDGQYIICGSEDQAVYIWKTQHEFYKFSSARRDRSDYWESVKGLTTFDIIVWLCNVYWLKHTLDMLPAAWVNSYMQDDMA